MSNINQLVLESFKEKFNKVKSHPDVRGGALATGIGAAVGGAYGLYSGVKRKTQVEDRVLHWKSRLAQATTPQQKEEAKNKLEYWTKVHRSKKRRGIVRGVSDGAQKGALGGAVSYGAQRAYQKFGHQ